MSAERTLWAGRPSYWNFWTSLAIADLLVLLAAALWWTGRARWAPWAAGAAAPFYLAAVLRRAGVRYAVTDQRVRAVSGLLSRRDDEVELGDIRSITLTQGLFERLAGIGTVAVSTAAGEGVEVTLKGIPGAEAVKETIRAARSAKGAAPLE